MKLRYSLGDDALDARALLFWRELVECEIEIDGVRAPHPQNYPHLDPFAESLEGFLLDNWAATIDLGEVTRQSIVLGSDPAYFCDPCIGHLFLMWHGTKEPGPIAPYLKRLPSKP